MNANNTVPVVDLKALSQNHQIEEMRRTAPEPMPEGIEEIIFLTDSSINWLVALKG